MTISRTPAGTSNTMGRMTVWLARVGFLSIAACTFGLSFDAIRDVAQDLGAVDAELAWIVPIAVDGMIVTATAVLWTESLSGRGWHMFPLLAIVGPAALSMWANVAHASGGQVLAQVLAAVPPAGLILSLELVAWQIRREVQPAQEPQESLPEPVQAATELAEPLQPPQPVAQNSGNGDIAAALRRYRDDNPDATPDTYGAQATVARLAGVHSSTVKRSPEWREWKATLAPSSNGAH